MDLRLEVFTPIKHAKFLTSITIKAQGGLVLVLVLWMVSLLAVIAGSFVYSARTSVYLSGNLVDQARARGLANAGIQRGIFELLKSEADGERWNSEGVANEFELDGVIVTVSMRDEAAKIDINTGSDELLKGLFGSVGLDEAEANQMLASILDWRDGDDLPRLGGAEKEQYEAAGLDYAPPNAAFRTVMEVQHVLGIQPEIMEKIQSSLTVYSRQRGIFSSLASREVLMACPGSTEEAVEAFIQYRDDALKQSLSPDPFVSCAAFASSEKSRAYSINAAVKLNNVAFVQNAVVRIGTDPKSPFVILSWE